MPDRPREPMPQRAVPLRPTGLRRPDRSRPTVKLALTGQLPAHPATADHLAGVREWNGRTNTRYGTCGPVNCANSAIMTWKQLLGTEISVSDDAIFDLYRRSGNPTFDPQTGQGDDGVDMTVMLAALVKGGITITLPDGTTQQAVPYVFAEVGVQGDQEAMHAGTAIFGGMSFAFDLDQAQNGQTNAGLWDYVPASRPWGGHAVFGGAYTSATDPHALDESIITWQQRVGTTPGFISHQLYGAYVIVWAPLWENPAFVAGVDRAALVADFEALTGRPWTGPPVPPPPEPEPPQPPPSPEPPPSPAPDAVLADYLGDARLIGWAGKRHLGDNGYAARAYARLRDAEGAR